VCEINTRGQSEISPLNIINISPNWRLINNNNNNKYPIEKYMHIKYHAFSQRDISYVSNKIKTMQLASTILRHKYWKGSYPGGISLQIYANTIEPNFSFL
jgi:hypothetical protein